MNHFVIGTAGHIDHGKTQLTRSLTGIHTDRLKEEKERNISIEPGYAPLTLPSGRQASIVDVPGHERFIRQMVAGVAGIDFVLLVVAADDGVMPQTEEHLHILHLLGIQDGLIVLTKVDRADPDLIELVEEDIRETVKHTFLRNAPLVRVSSLTGEGIESLKQRIDEQLMHIRPRQSGGFFRMPIDRAFTIKGAGTVVTGTVQSGSAEVGSLLELLPSQQQVKVRQAEVHGQSVNRVTAGQRAALNIKISEKETLRRGQVLAAPATWKPSVLLDVRATFLSDAGFLLKHRSLIKLLIGTAEVQGEILLYDRKEWAPGEEVYATLRLQEPVIAARGDRFILRRPTPADTVGGGEVVLPAASKRKIRPESAKQIARLWEADLPTRIQDALAEPPLWHNKENLARSSGEDPKNIDQALKQLIVSGHAVQLENGFSSRAALDQKAEEIIKWLADIHQRYPMRPGVPRQEWSARFLSGTSAKEAQILLQYWTRESGLKVEEEYIRLASFEPSLPQDLQTPADVVLQRLLEDGFTPREWEEAASSAGLDSETAEELRQFLIRRQLLYPITNAIAMHHQPFAQAVELVTEQIRKLGGITMQEAKEVLPLSRKYLVPLLERMDQEGITRRKGNQRVLA
jgi:selenocysteine-specific elongation factor